MNGCGVDMTVAPPASASVHRPSRSAAAARSIATSDDEHAVSTVMLGPRNPSTYEMRPDATLPAEPMARCASSSFGCAGVP